MVRHELQSGPQRGSVVHLRELRGDDELRAREELPLIEVELLRRLVVGDGVDVEALSVTDRDLLLAALFKDVYGDRVESTVPCSSCGEPFDLSFPLADLVDSRRPSVPDGVSGPDADGAFENASGVRFRAPTVADLRAAMHAPVGQRGHVVLDRCIVSEVDGHGDLEAVLEQIAPVLDVDIDVQCPECDTSQSVHFSIGSFLLGALRQEGYLVTREVHRLASAYGWTLAEILGLPRSQRRALASMVERERSAWRRPVA